MKKVRAAIVGYGNIGHYVLEALQAAPDFEIAGVVRRAGAENKPEELANYAVVKDIKELEGVEVAILCTPTRSVEKYAKEYLAMGINTVDSFDIHTGIVDLRRTLDATAKEHKAVSIISAGWDPGSDSIVRTMLEAIAPKGITYTNFGPGMSMGHGVNLTRKGVSGKTQNQLFEFNMRINNPALTAQVLVCVARASMKQQPGCYTMVEVPVIDLLPGDREEWIGHLV